MIRRFPEITIRRYENAFKGVIITQSFETDPPLPQPPETMSSCPSHVMQEKLYEVPAGLFSDYYAHQRQVGIPRYTPVDDHLPRYSHSVDVAVKGEYDAAIKRLIEKVHSGNWTEEPFETVVPFKEEEIIPKGELVFQSSRSPSHRDSRHSRRRSRSPSSSYYY